MKYVYIVQHFHILPDGEEDTKLIGVYSTVEAARAAVERLAKQPGFSDEPEIINPGSDDEEQGYYIDKYKIDEDHWTDGFATMVGGEEYSE